MSPAEVLRHDREVMGTDLGPLYSTLWQEVAWLNIKWKQYQDLYGDSKQTVDLLNKVAPNFFHVVQLVLWDDILLHLACLTDPEKTGGHANLTIKRLAGAIPEELNVLHDEVERAVGIAEENCSFAREWRNKSIAHIDMERAMGVGELTPLPAASREKAEIAIRSIGVVLNAISVHFNDSELRLDIIAGLQGAKALVCQLRMFMQQSAVMEDRWKRGLLTREEWEAFNLLK